MKLTKKVLAVVMALGLIACMSAMAFAAGYETVATKNDKTLYVTVYAKDMIGLESDTITVTYTGVKFNHASIGADAKKVNDTLDNGFFSDINNKADNGEVIFGFYFKENLWDAQTFYENGADAPVVIDSNNFELVTFQFDNYDPAKTPATVTVNGVAVALPAADANAEVPTTDAIPVNGGASNTPINPNKEKDPSNDKPETEKAAEKDDACNKVIKTDAGKDTGDNGVIAVVAGVIALAGAAFVVTKKRK